jgi:hypothetical protein
MKKSINSKILATAALAVIAPSFTNVASANEVKNNKNAIDDISYGHPNQLSKVGATSISTQGITEVYNRLIGLSDKERTVIANKMRTDFKGFMNDNFSLNEGENYCLSNFWRKDPGCLKFIQTLADNFEKGAKLDSVDFDEVGLNTIPYAKRQASTDIDVHSETNTSTGQTTVHVGIKIHF